MNLTDTPVEPDVEPEPTPGEPEPQPEPEQPGENAVIIDFNTRRPVTHDWRPFVDYWQQQRAAQTTVRPL